MVRSICNIIAVCVSLMQSQVVPGPSRIEYWQAPDRCEQVNVRMDLIYEYLNFPDKSPTLTSST